jgi:Protein of unknown function (DUF3074)
MAELHEALLYLKPTTWADVPSSSSSSSSTDLHKYTREILNKARLIIETVPEQNPSSASLSDIGTSAASIIKKPKSNNNNGNGNGSLLLLSQSQLDSLRKEWGKPLKMNNAKENPLNVPVYKLAGKDGKGAWFARRSVHKGLPFSRWKGKMQAEMEESLKARQEEIRQGRTPEMCIRGIGGDRRLEKVHVQREPETDHRDDDNNDNDDQVATIEIYQQSAQFPGPTTPRDFVTMMITSDIKLLSDGSDDDPPLPPTYMIVSKPCLHPDAPPQNNYIRGQYESVELIRELPIEKSTKQKPAPTNGDNDKSKGETEEDAAGDAPNPVEWIMITRSDPGGSVPKWMVERGTPKSITGDAVKFLNWASKPDLLGEGEDTADIGELTQMTESVAAKQRLPSNDGAIEEDEQPDAVGAGNNGAVPHEYDDDNNNVDDEQEDNNIWSNVAKMVHTGLQDYAPKAVLNYIPDRLSPSLGWDQETPNKTTLAMREAKSGPDDSELREEEKGNEKEKGETGIDEANDMSSLASDDSFTSADSHVSSTSTPQVYSGQDPQSQSASAMTSEAALGTTQALNDKAKTKPSSREKEIAKLNARKREVEINLASVQSEIRELGALKKGDNSKSDVDSALSGDSSNNKNDEKGTSSTSTTTSANANATISAATQVAIAAQNQKRTETLLRTEAKLISRLNKIEAQQLKASKKLEEHQRKAAGRAEKSRSRTENESLRKEVTSLRQEVRGLREEREKWLDIVGRMQKENSRLIAEARSGGGKQGGYGTD